MLDYKRERMPGGQGEVLAKHTTIKYKFLWDDCLFLVILFKMFKLVIHWKKDMRLI